MKIFLSKRIPKKSLGKISEKELYDCLKNDIPEGWEVHFYKIDKWKQYIKIRRKYKEDEIAFNEDGYKYNDLFLQPDTNVNHYKCVSSKGFRSGGDDYPAQVEIIRELSHNLYNELLKLSKEYAIKVARQYPEEKEDEIQKRCCITLKHF